MIDYKIYQNKNSSSKSYNKFYARSVASETYDIEKLSTHMSNHHTPYSPGMIKGVLTDMVSCIKELLLDGKCVKIDNLAIFGVGLKCTGSATVADFSVSTNIKGMRLKARATGELSVTKLKLESQVRQLAEYAKPATTTPTQP